VNLIFVDTMRSCLGNAARRRMLNGVRVTSLLATVGVMLGGAAHSQVAVPKYQSPITAPTQQLSLPTPPAVTTNGSVVEYPIVRVNDQIIDNSDYQRAENQLVVEAHQSNVSPSELAQRQKDLLRDMIDQQLLLSRGKELDIKADAEVIRRLDEIRKQNHLDSMEALEKAVRDSGISFEDFKANINNSVVTQEVVRDEVGRNLRLTAKEEQAYYDQHKQEFEQPEQVRLSEILIPTPDDATDAQIAQAQAKADMVAAKLKAGDKFEDLAKQYSGGPNPDTGGDLGQFKRGALAKVLEDQTFPLKTGESTSPIRTRQGFVVLKVTEHTPAGVPPLSAVDEQVQQAIYAQAIAPALRTYLTKLREDAYIDIAPGFVDTGASPKQTKPVFAGATAPPVKKKKVEQKARLDHGRTTTPTAVPATGSSTAAAQPEVASAAASSTPAAKNVSSASTKKRKKIKREKIRYGQAPRNSLPAAPEETLAAGADQGPGAAASVLPASGEAIAPIDQSTSVATNVDPLAPAGPERKKTRFSDRAATEAKTKAAVKVAKVKQKIAATPAPMTEEEKLAQKAQSAPLGLSGDTATKKKKKRVKGAPKERIQEKAPAPPAPKPDPTPIPPKRVRDNGEPVVKPAPSTLPPVTVPAPGAPVDTQPTTPANPAPAAVPPQ
jgi:peptidyl-prolyl cis-trans isomerase SurA